MSSTRTVPCLGHHCLLWFLPCLFLWKQWFTNQTSHPACQQQPIWPKLNSELCLSQEGLNSELNSELCLGHWTQMACSLGGIWYLGERSFQHLSSCRYEWARRKSLFPLKKIHVLFEFRKRSSWCHPQYAKSTGITVHRSHEVWGYHRGGWNRASRVKIELLSGCSSWQHWAHLEL